MDKKISASALMDELASRAKVSQTASEEFVRVFFDTIIEGLCRDGIVKIKGLGTFKLSQVSDRESVAVATGERILIKGFRKISFTPEATLKEHINKPFALFETVDLNDESPLADSVETADNEEEEVEASDVEVPYVEAPEDAEPVAEVPVAEASATETAVAESPVAEALIAEVPVEKETGGKEAVNEIPAVEEPAPEDSAIEEPAAELTMEETPVEEEPVSVEPVTEVPAELPAAEKSTGKPHRKKTWLIWLITALLLIAAFILFYFIPTKNATGVQPNAPIERQQLESQRIEATAPATAETNSPAASSEEVQSTVDTSEKVQLADVAPEQAQPKVEVASAKNPGKPYKLQLTEADKLRSLKEYSIADTTEYVIDGTLLTHVVESGETLIRLSSMYYGDKRLWPYIVQYNHLATYNTIPVGKKLLIPFLKNK